MFEKLFLNYFTINMYYLIIIITIIIIITFAR